MKLSRFVKIMVLLTFTSLAYIHLEMEIIHLAYQGKAKQDILKKLTEENNFISYNISTLKSASNLGIQLLHDESGMHFADKEHIVHVAAASITGALPVNTSDEAELTPPAPKMLSLLSFGAQAEAGAQ